MKKMILTVIGLLSTFSVEATIVNGNPYINGTAFEGYIFIAKFCKDISCVQQNLKLIDSQIADLMTRRLAFVRRGAELKNSAVISDNTQVDANVLQQVTRQAQAQGMPPEIGQSVFRDLDKQSQSFEKKYQGLTPRSSPNTFSTPTHNVTNPVITPTITPGLGATPEVVPGAGQH